MLPSLKVKPFDLPKHRQECLCHIQTREAEIN